MPEKGELLVERETHKIWRNFLTTSEVLVESATASLNADAVRCFELLTAHGVPNHFLGHLNATTYRARELRMIPIEVLVRRRHGETGKEVFFPPMIVEFFHRINFKNEPQIICSFSEDVLPQIHAKKRLAEILRGTLIEGYERLFPFFVSDMVSLAERTFSVLEGTSTAQGMTLSSIKIRCGYDVTSIDEILVGNVAATYK